MKSVLCIKQETRQKKMNRKKGTKGEMPPKTMGNIFYLNTIFLVLLCRFAEGYDIVIISLSVFFYEKSINEKPYGSSIC